MRQSYLPTISELHAFCACARTGSATRAAETLNLTQSAVSRSLATLEDRLGIQLFDRVRQRLVLSEAGRAFQRDADRLLGDLEHAAVSMIAFGGERTVLRIAVLPTFGTRWLAGRLAAFRQHQPDVTIDLVSRLDAVDFDGEPFDGAIQRTELRAVNAAVVPLIDEVLVVVAAPSLIGEQGILDDSDLARLPLLQQTTRPTLWLDWFRDAGLDWRHLLRGDRFEHFDMVIHAAVGGLGVALVPEIVVADELAAGRLVIASRRRLVVGEPYALIHPQRSNDNAAFDAFREWLVKEAQASTARATGGDHRAIG